MLDPCAKQMSSHPSFELGHGSLSLCEERELVPGHQIRSGGKGVSELMAKKALFMETTEVSPTRTAGEIIAELVKCGATSINTEYDQGVVSGLRWVMKVHGNDVLFDMPVRVDPIYKILQSRRRDRWRYEAADKEQAQRVAWRQLLRWVQAQNAMIECGMVAAEEVYLPYLFDARSSQTLFQKLSESKFKMLAAPVEQ